MTPDNNRKFKKKLNGTQKIQMVGNCTKKRQKRIKIQTKHGEVWMCKKNGENGWK